MDTLADRLTRARTERGLSQADLAKAAGLKSQSIIGMLETSDRKTSAHIPVIASVLGVPALWLATGQGSSYLRSAAPIPTAPGDEFVAVARVSIRVSAGVTGWRVEHIDGNGPPIFFRADWLAARGFRAAQLYALKVMGDSMEPNLWADDLVVINSADTTPKDGEVFVANYEGEVVIKRLRRDAGEWWLESDNSRHKPKRCDEHAELIGRVIYKQSERI